MGLSEDIKQSNFRSSRLKAHINIIYTNNWIRDKYSSVFKKHGILEQHFNVLKIVNGSHPEKVSPGYIISVMLDKKRDLTRLVDKLVEQGFLARNIDENNRRRVEIEITDLGKELTLKIEHALQLIEAKEINISEEDAELLSTLLDKYRDSE